MVRFKYHIFLVSRTGGARPPTLSGASNGRGGDEAIAVPYARGPGSAERRAGERETEEGGKVEERCPEQDARGDPHRPPQQPNTAHPSAGWRR